MLHLVTGGSGSGKSAFAEETITGYHELAQGNLVYIATMLPYGEETQQKILRHRKMRENKGFQTIEQYTGLGKAEVKCQERDTEKEQEQHPPRAWDAGACVLLECISNLLANEMYQADGAGKDAVEAVIRGISFLQSTCQYMVIVANEVCSECAKDSEEMALYKCRIGEINCALAEMADVVTEVVCGIPLTVKDKINEKQSCRRPQSYLDYSSKTLKREGTGMKLIIGGAHQGKLAYAKREYKDRKWLDGDTCDLEDLYTCGGIFHFEGYLRRMMEDGRELTGFTSSLVENNPDIIIICAEIGSGLVPAEVFERNYREQTGRVCTELAGYAARVDRVICGIGTVLKGV